jgi:hypothetical protein
LVSGGVAVVASGKTLAYVKGVVALTFVAGYTLPGVAGFQYPPMKLKQKGAFCRAKISHPIPAKYDLAS